MDQQTRSPLENLRHAVQRRSAESRLDECDRLVQEAHDALEGGDCGSSAALLDRLDALIAGTRRSSETTSETARW